MNNKISSQSTSKPSQRLSICVATPPPPPSPTTATITNNKVLPSPPGNHSPPESMTENKISTAAAAPPPEFSFTLARVAVAQICKSVGYTGARTPALEALTDIATRYLKAVAKLSAESANSSGRTQSNIFDIISALEDMASVEGYAGAWKVRSPSLLRSAVVKDLMKFVKYMDEVPFAQPLPPGRSCSERGRVLKNRYDNHDIDSRWYDEGRLKHVPRWLPAVEGGEEAEVEVEQRRGEVRWECLDGGEKREEVVIMRRDEGKKMKRECSEEEWVKRGKVRFKLGILGN